MNIIDQPFIVKAFLEPTDAHINHGIRLILWHLEGAIALLECYRLLALHVAQCDKTFG